MKIRLAMGLALALLLLGCAPQSAGQLQERFDAAKAIENTSERDLAMENVAKDSADANVPDLALNSVNAIQSEVDKDNTAAYCARKMDKHGNRTAAEVFVHVIQNGALRDQLHFEFAAEAPPTPAASTQP
jgi:protein involved in sex pheromone biosynthesis